MFFQILVNWVRFQRSQWWPREKLIELQNKKLRLIIKHAYENVPFYHKLYSEAGINPDSIVDIESFRKLPIITKEDLRRVPLEERTARGIDVSKCEVRTTSGSTGAPIKILKEPLAIAYTEAFYLMMYWNYGIRPFHKICRVIPTPVGRDIKLGRMIDTVGFWGAFRRRKARPLSLATDIRAHPEFFLSWKPDAIMANPSYMRALVMVCEEVGKYPSFRIVSTRGEILDDSTRKLIMDFFSAEVFDAYGSAEVGPIAIECPTHFAYHIPIDFTVTEFLRNGGPVTSGEPGEVCVTGLNVFATPVIRYMLGDVATPIDDECPCGRGLPLLKNIQGRIVDYILTTDGLYVSPQLVIFTLQDIDGVDQFRVLQKKDYSIEVFVKVSGGEVEPVLREVARRSRLLFGETPIEVKVVDRVIDPDKPKFRIVESQIDKRSV